MEGPKIVENLFFAVTCVSIFTCTIRSDYNFAMGLLCYYMIKNASQKIGSIAFTLLCLNALTIGMDMLWCITMQSVWSGKPSKNAAAWSGFDHIRSFTLFLSAVNIVLKVVACLFLVPIYRGSKKSTSGY
jgi:hypothetical protein